MPKFEEFPKEGEEKEKPEESGKSPESSEEEKPSEESEKKESPEEKKIEGYKSFEDFGISNEDLEKIKGFEKMSEGRQALVLENLKQLTLGRIQEEAKEKYKEEKAESGFWGKLWKGVTKEYQIAKQEKVTKEELIKGGADVHGEVLKDLTKRAVDGPEVEIGENKELEMKYVPESGLNPEQERVVKEFNEIASDFSKVPEEWRFETSSLKNQKKYWEIKDRYDLAKGELLEFKTKEKNLPDAFEDINKVDGMIHKNQFLNTHPDAERELEKMSTSKAIRRAITTTAAERGGYMAAGYIARTATVGIMGLIGAPLAAAFLGGYKARRREKKSIKEQDIGARKGKEIKGQAGRKDRAEKITKEMESIRKSIEELKGKREKFEKTEEGEWEKKTMGELTEEEQNQLEYLEGYFEKLEKERAKVLESETGKDIVKAENLTKKMAGLIDRIENINHKIGEKLTEKKVKELTEERKKLFGMLKRRVDYTQEKVQEGLVNFGGAKERINSHYQLLEMTARAGICSNGEAREDIEERLEKFLQYKEKKIGKARTKKLNKAMLRGSLMSAGFATAGALAREATEFFSEGAEAVEAASGHGDISTEELETAPVVPPKVPEAEIDTTTNVEESVTAADIVKAESPTETVIPPEEIPVEKVLPSVEYQGGTSVWDEVENQIEARANFKGLLPENMDEAEHTHLVDYIKDKVAESPEKYGFPEDIDIDTPTKEQLRNLDWDKLFNESSGELDEALPNLTDVQKENIIENNQILDELVKKTGKPIDSETVNQTLTDIKEAGGVDEYLKTEVETPGEVEATEEPETYLSKEQEATIVEAQQEATKETEVGELEKKLSTKGAEAKEPEKVPGELEKKITAEGPEGLTKDERNLLQGIRNYNESSFTVGTGAGAKEETSNYLLQEAWENPEYLKEYSEFGRIVHEIQPNIEGQITSINNLESTLRKGFLGIGRAGMEEIKSAVEQAAQAFGLSEGQSESFLNHLTAGEEANKKTLQSIMEGRNVDWMKFREKVDSFRQMNI